MRSFSLLFVFIAVLLILSCPVSATTSNPISYYDLLQIEQSADDKSIKKAYRKLALVHHPDKATSETDRAEKENLFVQLANAYEVLSDSTYRPRYDWLLSHNIYDYDEKSHDWSNFNPETKQFEENEIVFGQGRFRYKTSRSYGDAAAMFARAQAEEAAETRALLMALAAALCVALTPLAYFYYGRLSSKLNDRKRKQDANEKLRENQSLVKEYHKEQAAEQERNKRENAARAQEIREARERALLEETESSSDEDQSVMPENAEPAELVDPTAAVPSDDEDDKKKRRATGQIFSCDLCRKKFKSSGQYEQHLQSNQHKKAEKSSR